MTSNSSQSIIELSRVTKVYGEGEGEVRIGAERFTQGSLVRLFDAELETGESYFLIMRKEDAARPDVQALTRWLLDEFSAAA